MSLYLVTGASGFIGRQMCRNIRGHGHRVRAMLRREESGPWDESHICDLTALQVPDTLLCDVDGIFHCAGAAHYRGLSREAKADLWHLNVDCTASLFQLAADAGVKRLVYFSSVQAAGKPGSIVADENWHATPDNLYGESKLAAEELLLKGGDACGMHVSVIRPALVYGPGVKGNLQRMLVAVAEGHMPSLPDSGKQRSMAALGNVVEAAWLAMDRDAAHGRCYIVCDEQSYSTRFLYTAMMRCAGRRIPSYRIPLLLFKIAAWLGDLGNRITDNAMPWDSAAYERLFGEACYSSRRIQAELGWRPLQDFEQNLPAMMGALAERRA